MAILAKRLPLFLATLVLGTAMLGTGAYAAVPSSHPTSTTAIAAEPAQATFQSGRPDTDRERDHHRRFCAKLDEVLSRLVANGVITREQKLRIMDAFNCDPNDRPTTRPNIPTTTRPAR